MNQTHKANIEIIKDNFCKFKCKVNKLNEVSENFSDDYDMSCDDCGEITTLHVDGLYEIDLCKYCMVSKFLYYYLEDETCD